MSQPLLPPNSFGIHHSALRVVSVFNLPCFALLEASHRQAHTLAATITNCYTSKNTLCQPHHRKTPGIIHIPYTPIWTYAATTRQLSCAQNTHLARQTPRIVQSISAHPKLDQPHTWRVRAHLLRRRLTATTPVRPAAACQMATTTSSSYRLTPPEEASSTYPRCSRTATAS